MFFFIVWRGWGILGILIPLGICSLCAAIAGAIGVALGGQRPFAGATAAAIVIGGIVSGVIVWRLGVRLNSAPGRVLIDPRDNSRVVLRRTHSLFWIPLQYWGPISAVLAMCVALALLATGVPG